MGSENDSDIAGVDIYVGEFLKEFGKDDRLFGRVLFEEIGEVERFGRDRSGNFNRPLS